LLATEASAASVGASVGQGASNASPLPHAPIPAPQTKQPRYARRKLFQLDDLDHFSRQSILPASLRSDLDRNRRNNDRFHPVSLIDITGIRTMIMENVWNASFEGLTNVVDVYISALRRKIDRDVAQKLIQTNRGIGYTLTCTDCLPSKPLSHPDFPVQRFGT